VTFFFVFFNNELHHRCQVAIELKAGIESLNSMGQMNFYLSALSLLQ